FEAVNELRMTLQGYLTSPIGLLNAISVLINIAALLCLGIHWTDEGNVYMQFIFQNRGWQTAVLIFLTVSITVTAALLLIRTFASREKIENMKKITIISLLVFVFFLCAFAAAIEIWYVVRSDSNKDGLTRVVVCMILSIVLFIVNLLLTMLLLCNFDHYVKTEQASPVVNPSNPQPPYPSHHPAPHPMVNPHAFPQLNHDQPMRTIEPASPPHSKNHPEPTPMITLPPSPPQKRRNDSEDD
ncbi:hypothetical protein PFISCL1PPCAC_22565, partial [Pristionchus fissidentatus]